MRIQESFGLQVKGHVKIVDDLGNVLLDNDNAIHPQNMARIIARALANESNSGIYRIAFGNGGTTTDAAFTVSYNPPNDGLPPDTRTWDSRLYNETYSEVIDEGNVTINAALGTDPGSADSNTGTRPGGGSVASSDPTTTIHTSGPGVRSVEQGLVSQVIITCVLNPDEPTGQTTGAVVDPNFGNSFAFDEIGLYSGGARASDSTGVHDADVGNKKSSDVALNIVPGTTYGFAVAVDGGSDNAITFTPPAALSSVTYGQICEALNTGDPTWNPAWGGVSPLPGGASVAITDETLLYPSITGAQTYGYLRFSSSTSGNGSSIVVKDQVTAPVVSFFSTIAANLLDPVEGADAGVQNDPLNPETERERLLTHIIFSPVLKAAQRTLTVTYTLSIYVARST